MKGRQFRRAIGDVLREHRVGLALSQEEFAAKVGLHRTYIGSVERGERNISIDNLLKISNALSASLSQLVSEAEANCPGAYR